MKIGAVLELAQRKDLPRLQKAVLEYMEAHADEVFSYRDEKLVRDLKAKASAVGFTLWTLHKKGLIEKQNVGGKIYFGSKQAMAELRGQLGISQEDPFDRATRNLLRIRDEVGNVDVQELLDEVREDQ